MLHAHPKTPRLEAVCQCGAATVSARPDVLRRIADRTDVRFRCQRCKTRLVWFEGEAPRFALESEVGR